VRKVLHIVLVAAVAMTAMPAGAQDFGPNTIWGDVPRSTAAGAETADLLDLMGNIVATLPVIDGRFAFTNLVPGDYVVAVRGAQGRTLATSLTANLAVDGVTRANFGDDHAAAAVPGGGRNVALSRLLLIGAAGAGIAVAIVLLSDDVASPSR
jgi:hypothetical protein